MFKKPLHIAPRIKLEQLPWRRKMTLCMAVACEHEDRPRIVLCNDWKEELPGIGSGEYTDKLHWIGKNWPVLSSGTSSRIEELVGIYINHLSKTKLTEHNYLEELKTPAKQFKGVLAEDYIQQLLGMPYSHFLEYGKERLPEDFFRERVSEIGRITLGASLIITGFLLGEAIGDLQAGSFPIICVVDGDSQQDDMVREEIHFASIGAGTYAANAALYNRSVNDEMPLLGAIYAVFEAHRWSEKVPGVGKSISIDILEPPGILRTLSEAGYDYCEFLWRRFGPREVQQRKQSLFEMKDEYFEPIP